MKQRKIFTTILLRKTYQWPEYIEEVEFKDKRKLKIAFNKFYENI